MSDLRGINWSGVQNLHTMPFQCGYCMNKVASDKGWDCADVSRTLLACVRLCTMCNKPTVFYGMSEQVPGAPFGRKVEHIPPEIEPLYQEAKRCFQVNAFTGCVLCSRAILMHIAVQHGADEGENFVNYVSFIMNNHLIPAKSKPAAEKIRTKGNAATHKIEAITKEDAELILYFLEILMVNIYEIEGKTGSTP